MQKLKVFFAKIVGRLRNIREKNPFFGMWCLITLAFIVIVAISFAEGLDLGFYSFKSSSFKDNLTKVQTPDTLAVADTIPDKPKEVQPDTTVKNVLVFGDSMTVLLARRIADYGAKNGYKVTSITWDGSTTLGWCDSEKLTGQLANQKPDFIFISLGGNEINLSDPNGRSKYVKRLLSHFEDIPFIWVGPPMETKGTKFEEMILSLVPEGSYFRSDFPVELGPDHIHPTRDGATVMIDSLMRWIPKSHHPILNLFPDTLTGDFTHIYFNTKGERKN